MKTGAELEAPAESSEAVDKKEKETDVRKQAAASRPRFRGEIQYEQLEQQRAAAESAPGSTVRILRTGGRSTAAEREDYRRVQPPQQGALSRPARQAQPVRQTQPMRQTQPVRQAQPMRQTQPVQSSGVSRSGRGGQTSGRNQTFQSRAEGSMSSGRSAVRTGTAVSGRQSRPAAGERPRFHPAKEQQEYGKNRARAAAVRRKKKRQRRAFLGAGLLILALAAGGAGFGLVRWKAGSKKRELAEQGVMAMNVGDYETAITVFDQALEGSGKRIGNFEEDVLFNRAEAEYKQGDFAAALATYQIILKADSENEMARQGAALCLAEAGEWDQALALGVLQSQIYSRMAAAQIEAGQYEEAMQTIAQGRSLPDQSAARNLDFNEAVIREKQGDFAAALELFEAYREKYGADEAAEREIIFLKSRQ